MRPFRGCEGAALSSPQRGSWHWCAWSSELEQQLLPKALTEPSQPPPAVEALEKATRVLFCVTTTPIPQATFPL